MDVDDGVAGPNNCSNSCSTVSNTENPCDLSVAPSSSREFIFRSLVYDEAPVSIDLKGHNRQFEVIYNKSLSPSILTCGLPKIFQIF